jgi:hypothetical protein
MVFNSKKRGIKKYKRGKEKMNVFDKLQEKYDEITKEYLEKLAEVDKAIEVAQNLPPEIQAMNDCEFVLYWD